MAQFPPQQCLACGYFGVEPPHPYCCYCGTCVTVAPPPPVFPPPPFVLPKPSREELMAMERYFSQQWTDLFKHERSDRIKLAASYDDFFSSVSSSLIVPPPMPLSAALSENIGSRERLARAHLILDEETARSALALRCLQAASALLPLSSHGSLPLINVIARRSSVTTAVPTSFRGQEAATAPLRRVSADEGRWIPTSVGPWTVALPQYLASHPYPAASLPAAPAPAYSTRRPSLLAGPPGGATHTAQRGVAPDPRTAFGPDPSRRKRSPGDPPLRNPLSFGDSDVGGDSMCSSDGDGEDDLGSGPAPVRAWWPSDSRWKEPSPPRPPAGPMARILGTSVR